VGTTQRGIWYPTTVDDSDVADLTVIIKRTADSVETAMDTEAATAIPGRVLTDSSGRAEVALPTPPSGKRWSVTTGVENKVRADTPTVVKQTMGTSSVVFTVEQWTGSWVAVAGEVHYCARLVSTTPGGGTN
jgi:hypothetical protein